MAKQLSIKEFIVKFSEYNQDLPGDCVEAVLKRLFDSTVQLCTPYDEYLINLAYLEYMSKNGNKKMSAIIDVSIDFNKSEKTIRNIVEKYDHLNRRKAS